MSPNDQRAATPDRGRGVDAVGLEVVRHRLASVAEAMGAALRRAAHSPNIKERRDYSCAVFDADGRLLAQAAHIPVHLGAMPASVDAARGVFEGRWQAGDVVVLNDPQQGGSHLPDLTTVSPVFVENDDRPHAFLATRAHHADIGGATPGSMGAAREIFGEGLILPPVRLQHAGQPVADLLRLIAANSRTPKQREGDLAAQLGAHHVGQRWLRPLLASPGHFLSQATALLSWSEELARTGLAGLPLGEASFEDCVEDDGLGGGPYVIRVRLRLAGREGIHADFTGTAAQAPGGINAPRAVSLAALRYVSACMLPNVPHNDGGFAPLSLEIPRGSLLDPLPPAAVAAGNVETSQRIVDVLLGALAQLLPEQVPAASHGTMNNVLGGGIDLDGKPWAYYETTGGGAGASAAAHGASGRQTHMTNTRNTPVEAIEIDLPLRIERYALREGSGGHGLRRGGQGVERTLRFLAPATITLVAERRACAPYGLQGGQAGQPGEHLLHPADGSEAIRLPAKTSIDVESGDLLVLRTPGGGGWGADPPPLELGHGTDENADPGAGRG